MTDDELKQIFNDVGITLAHVEQLTQEAKQHVDFVVERLAKLREILES